MKRGLAPTADAVVLGIVVFELRMIPIEVAVCGTYSQEPVEDGTGKVELRERFDMICRFYSLVPSR